LPKWQYLKGAKKEVRKTAGGIEYNYGEGGMIFPEPLDNASRTIITVEGGRSASRFKHVVEAREGL
jgi:DNA (cytosine-5)-methyltransferase 1